MPFSVVARNYFIIILYSLSCVSTWRHSYLYYCEKLTGTNKSQFFLHSKVNLEPKRLEDSQPSSNSELVLPPLEIDHTSSSNTEIPYEASSLQQPPCG